MNKHVPTPCRRIRTYLMFGLIAPGSASTPRHIPKSHPYSRGGGRTNKGRQAACSLLSPAAAPPNYRGSRPKERWQTPGCKSFVQGLLQLIGMVYPQVEIVPTNTGATFHTSLSTYIPNLLITLRSKKHTEGRHTMNAHDSSARTEYSTPHWWHLFENKYETSNQKIRPNLTTTEL